MDGLQPAGDTRVTWSDQYVKDQEGGWVWGCHREASPEQQEAMKHMVRGHRHCFAYSMADLPGYHKPVNIGKYRGAPAYQRPRKYIPVEEEIVEAKCVELRDASLIVRAPLDNPFAARPTIAAKKNAETGEWTDHRFCVNYVPGNKGTETIPHGLPLPEDIFRSFGTARFFTKMDMRSGFHQLVLDEESQLRTAFWWGRELWCYTRLPFGLKNSSAIYQRVMDSVLQEAGVADFARAFIDDVIIYSDTADQHVEHVRRVLEALEAAGLRVHPDKSIFMAEGVEFLGHIISPSGMQPHEARLAAFKQLQLPRTKEELASQLGILGFYRCYLPGYSQIMEPLRRMRKASSPSVLQWDDETRAAYQGLLDGLTQDGLCLRREDPGLPFVLHTDWSVRGLGAILTQVDQYGQEGIVACISRSLNEHEARYPAWKGELLAVVWAVKHFKPYLAGRDFTVITDHRPLLWLMTAPQLAGQQERWVLALQEFSFAVQHRQGLGNPADAPSRYPLTSSADPTGARLDEEGSVTRVVPRVVFATEEARQQAIAEFIEGTSVAPQGVAVALASVAGTQLSEPRRSTAAAAYQLCSMVCSAVQPVASAVVSQVVVGGDIEEEGGPPPVSTSAEQLQQWAASRVQAVLGTQGPLSSSSSGPQEQAHLQPFYRELSQGVIVVELFGGLCAGLEACLRNGWRVKRYIYADNDPRVRRVAVHRVAALAAQYPDQLPVEACHSAFTRWPQDVTQLQRQHLEQIQQLGGPCVLWAGWPCQDLSPAGAGRGLAGRQSGTFFALRRVMSALQELLAGRFAWVVENTAMAVPWQRSEAVLRDYHQLCTVLGQPLQLDAAQFGSRAHRLRCYWTNLAPYQQLKQVIRSARRPPGRTVQQVLDPGRSCKEVQRDDAPPFYCCNKVGQPMQALPTLMATVGSYAFRDQGPGLIWDQRQGKWTEPNPDERERAMGFTAGTTAAPGVSALVRHQVLGRCMDCNTVVALVAVSQAVAVWSAGGVQPPAGGGCQWEVGSVQLVTRGAAASSASQQQLMMLWVAAAAVADQQEGRDRDIWSDSAALHWLQSGGHSAGVSRSEKARIAHRARLYRWHGGELQRRMPDGTFKQVPAPADREALVQRIHDTTGHYGVRRTAAMVLANHWWRTLHQDVAQVVRSCSVCDRVKATFATMQPQLSPLPIEPMFYRWGFDLAGEFPVTAKGNKWVLIAVEHFSKHIELIPLKDKSAPETATAAAEVLCRFGAPAEVVTDGGGEWEGEFDRLLSSCFIDHRVTSAFHPQANGLAERVVQVVKRGLRKLCEARSTTQWDAQLPWVALGYRCSKQSSTGHSPYELLYARQPVFPSAVQPKMAEELDMDDQESAAASVLRRAEWLRQRMPVAADNLKAAQHRDTLRYQHLRSKGYLPKVASFLPGDFVYLKRQRAGSTLAIKAKPYVLRVKRVLGGGVVLLEDKAGQELKQHINQLAPCHIPDLDGTIDRALAGEDQAAECVMCGLPDDPARFMFCDGCNLGWHTYCCTPRLERVPEGCFICERCRAAGVTEQQVQEQEVVREGLRQQGSMPDLFPLAQQRMRDDRAAELHGRLVTKQQGRGRKWGRVMFKGFWERPRYFLVRYADGSQEDGLTHRMITTGKAYKLQDSAAVAPLGVTVPEAGPLPVR